jgi:hypothetical protein
MGTNRRGSGCFGCYEYINSIPIRKFSLRFGYMEPTDEILNKLKGLPRGSIIGRIPIKRQRLFLYSIFLNKVINECRFRCYEIDNFSNYFPYISMFKVKRYLEWMLYYLIKKFFSRQYKMMKRKANPVLSKWVAHLKKFARAHKMKYNEAMRDPRARASFKR